MTSQMFIRLDDISRALDYVRAPHNIESRTDALRLLILAQAIVGQYLGTSVVLEPPPEGFLDLTAEAPLPDDACRYMAQEAAILLVFAELYANREAGTANPLSPTVRSLLDMLRGPVCV